MPSAQPWSPALLGAFVLRDSYNLLNRRLAILFLAWVQGASDQRGTQAWSAGSREATDCPQNIPSNWMQLEASHSGCSFLSITAAWGPALSPSSDGYRQ